MEIRGLGISLLVVLLCLVVAPAHAQRDDALTLSVAKSFGYAWRGEMQGLFTLKASGPTDLARVTFLLDGQPLGETNAPPFTLQFATDDYPLGSHTLSVMGVTTDGRTLRSDEIHATFVSSERGWQVGLSVAGPLIALVLGFVLIVTVASLKSDRAQKAAAPGTPRRYGFLGGAVCPKCGRPFSLHAYGLNVVTRHYDRCPYCGKWSMVRAASRAELRAAEEAEAVAAVTDADVSALNAEDELRRGLENSRYVDS
jgi:DNA-directed RNA polymerase subunit RPC12/RpoP